MIYLVRILNAFGGDGLIDSIIKRHGRLDPYNETQIAIIRYAAKLFLENGYTKTTIKELERVSGIKTGNITYYFHSKEDLLNVLMEELMDFHANMIEEIYEAENDALFAYAIEIAAQIALSETHQQAWDLYHAAYSLPRTYESIRGWAAEKNCRLLKDLLPNWSERDFRKVEIVASGIELAALKTVCDRTFTLDDKVSLVLDSMMMLYGIPEKKRRAAIEKVLHAGYEQIADDMFDRFVKRLDNE